MGVSFLSLVFVAAFVANLSRAVYVPAGFACTPDQPLKSGVYSTPPSMHQLKVDLIHIFCGQVYAGDAHGFHARPGDADPPSAQTSLANRIRRPLNQNDFAMYRKPKISGKYGVFVEKNGVSGIWPTVWSMEKIVKAITELDTKCAPPAGKNLCVKKVSIINNTGPFFDVKIIIKVVHGRRVARTAFPVNFKHCDTVSIADFEVCNFPLWT